MATDELSIIEWIFKGLVSICLSVGGWMWVMLIRKVNQTSQELNDHKVEVAKTYAQQSSLERIHDRIDAAQKGIDDIKTLLITNFKS